MPRDVAPPAAPCNPGPVAPAGRGTPAPLQLTVVPAPATATEAAALTVVIARATGWSTTRAVRTTAEFWALVTGELGGMRQWLKAQR